MTIETSSKPCRSGRWLLVAALVLGGLLFLGQYLGLAAMNLVRLLSLPFQFVAALDWLYLFPLGLLFSNPVVY